MHNHNVESSHLEVANLEKRVLSNPCRPPFWRNSRASTKLPSVANSKQRAPYEIDQLSVELLIRKRGYGSGKIRRGHEDLVGVRDGGYKQGMLRCFRVVVLFDLTTS